MRTLLLDTHVLQWWSAEPERLSEAATDAITGADELVTGDGVTIGGRGWLWQSMNRASSRLWVR